MKYVTPQAAIDRAESLGLACLVEAAGSPGKRSTFRFYLPGGVKLLGEVDGTTPALAWLDGWAARDGAGLALGATVTVND